jgi:hypothetical protein
MKSTPVPHPHDNDGPRSRQMHSESSTGPPQWVQEDWAIEEVQVQTALSEIEARKELTNHSWDVQVISTSSIPLIIDCCRDIQAREKWYRHIHQTDDRHTSEQIRYVGIGRHTWKPDILPRGN